MVFKRTSGNWTAARLALRVGRTGVGHPADPHRHRLDLRFAENGVVRISATDTTLTGGAPGIMAYGTAQADNWVGVGTTGTTGTYSVGGTVSGLSGTVVLEDNGGDDLSVSANGTFTFATLLARTPPTTSRVKTNPSVSSAPSQPLGHHRHGQRDQRRGHLRRPAPRAPSPTPSTGPTGPSAPPGPP